MKTTTYKAPASPGKSPNRSSKSKQDDEQVS